MSYWRPVKLQPRRLEVLASLSWSESLLQLLNKHRHFFSDHVCLRTIRNGLEDYIKRHVPASVEENLFQTGLEMMAKDLDCRDGEMLTPHMFVLYMFVLYRSSIKYLDIPSLGNHSDRVTVLDLLYNVGAQHGHQVTTVKFKMFEHSNISIEENYLTKRVLRGFMDVTTLVLWRAADDAMLQIIGHTCRTLQTLDLWKCSKVTDSGVEMMLGLEAQGRTKLCQSLEKITIRDTAITHLGAFNLLLHCPGLHSLEFSHGTFIRQFLDLIELHSSQSQSPVQFSLKSIFLPVSSERSLQSVIKSLPRLEEVSLWTSLSHLPPLAKQDLKYLKSLKVGGLTYSSFLTETVSVIGQQLVTLKIETVHFDINIDIIGQHCPNLEDLSVINARLAVTQPTEKTQQVSSPAMFRSLRKVYLFLVSYLTVPDLSPRAPHSVSDPARLETPVTGRTALHSILSQGRALETITVNTAGNTNITDVCLADILSVNPLTELRRLVISLPSSQESMLVIPLTLVSVAALAQSCPHLTCLGDLRHWAISPGQRKDMVRPVGSLQQNIWTRVKILADRAGQVKSSSVCQQTWVL